jgi:Cys-tRNA(Pro)/Cys-tRNA(Cys) deacylase
MGAKATLDRVAGRRTPAVVAAERAGVAFTVHEYAHDPRAPSYGLEAVEKLGLDPARVFKTLVADVDGTLTVAVVPVEGQLDLRALGKRARLAEAKDADVSALAFDTIHVSAGRRGLELELAPGDLVALTDARTAAVASRP